MGGESIQGKWINKRTGQVINVRDSVIDGDNMIIISDIGNLSMEEFSNNYIQGSDDLYNEQGQVIGHQEMSMEEILAVGSPAQQPMYEEIKNAYPVEEAQPKNNQIIAKIFNKLESLPEPNVEVIWDEFPEAQINTLIDFLDVTVDEISEYIYNNYVNKENIIKKISEFLNNKLSK